VARPAPHAAGAADATDATDASTAYQCSQYWGQHSQTIPPAYGRTTAPTQLCGYTVSQLREAYGISSSPYTGKGATIAVVLDGDFPTALADADTFFAGQGVPGYAPGQYSENLDSTFAASCDGDYDEPEESLDVETAHIAAPDAKVVYVGADCDLTNPAGQQRDLLDAMTRVVDQHLADVVTESFSIDEAGFSPADAASWDPTFQQGAIEGIGFDFDSGDGGDDVGLLPDNQPSVTFPASDPWATAVGGTSLMIGPDGTAVADYAWGDSGTEENPAGNGYVSPPPGQFVGGSTGGLSTLFAQPAYQNGVVPAALATRNGSEAAQRVVPDIAANAGSSWLIAYTGSVTPGVYSVISEGGTSGASPMIAGLEADAIQASGHPLGFVNPALYRLSGTSAVQATTPVDPSSPPIVFGPQPILGPGGDFLTTLGEDSSLQTSAGYDDATGIGAPSCSFVTAFNRF
jgi:subtilase family serine protease